MTLSRPLSAAASPLGILAGNGRLPGEIARAAAVSGRPITILTIGGDAASDLSVFSPIPVGFGQVGKIIGTFRSAGCREIVIVGGVNRPDLARLKPDLGLVTNLSALVRLIWSGGDDGLLRAVVRLFEAKGFTVVSPGSVAPSLLVASGPAGTITPSPADAADMLLGSSVVRALGRFDVGQAVVVSGGEIEAIEAAEGTDRMMARVTAHRLTSRTRGGVLVKRPKPGQEMRVDMPTIGPDTVTRAAAAQLSGIAVLAGETLIAERTKTIAAAADHGLFLYGFTEQTRPPVPQRQPRQMPAVGAADVHVLAGRHPGRIALSDAALGAAALASLAQLARDGSTVVSRGYVLGLEPRGGEVALFARVTRLKPWGEGRWRTRSGTAVLGSDLLPTHEMIAAASHLQAIAMSHPRADLLATDVLTAARAAGLTLLTVRSIR